MAKDRVAEKCPFCGKSLVQPSGPDNASVGIISEYPGQYELRHLIPFVADAPAGKILRRELSFFKLDYEKMRVTNVWRHDPSSQEGEYDWHRVQAIKAVANCKYLLLLGSEATSAFLGNGVMAVSGLWSNSLYFPDKLIMPAPNPAALIHGTVGEFRLALQKFSEELKHDEQKETATRTRSRSKRS